MGKKLYRRSDISKTKTKELNLDEIYALKDSNESQYHIVHERYFSGDKLPCPACGSKSTRCSKILRRSFKDILWGEPAVEEGKRRTFKIIDLIFHQRYVRCNDCGDVFPEPISFGEKGCKYTLRLSDALANGTFRYSYKKVCDYYSVPASTASIGPIMRRQLQYRKSLLAPLAAFQKIGILEVTFHNKRNSVIFTLRPEGIYCIDILPDSSEETLVPYLRTISAKNIDAVYIDPVDSYRNAVTAAIPNAKVIVTDECILRYAKEAMFDVSAKEGKRFPLKHRNKYLTTQRKYIGSAYDLEKMDEGLSSRPILKNAYEHYQELLNIMSGNWTYENLAHWLEGLSDDRDYYAPLVDAIELFETEICNAFDEEKLPDDYQSSTTAIQDAFAIMPYCIFDVLRGRCFLTIPHDSLEENGKKYRLGIRVSRLVENMNEITKNIKEAREYGDE